MANPKKQVTKRPEPWRVAWRKNVVPHLSTKGLKALLKGLIEDDKNIIQFQGLVDDFDYNENAKPTAGCAIGYAMMKSGYKTNLSIHYKYLEMTGEYDFTSWFDHTEREKMRAKLIPEVKRAIAKRCKLTRNEP